MSSLSKIRSRSIMIVSLVLLVMSCLGCSRATVAHFVPKPSCPKLIEVRVEADGSLLPSEVKKVAENILEIQRVLDEAIATCPCWTEEQRLK